MENDKTKSKTIGVGVGGKQVSQIKKEKRKKGSTISVHIDEEVHYSRAVDGSGSFGLIARASGKQTVYLQQTSGLHMMTTSRNNDGT